MTVFKTYLLWQKQKNIKLISNIEDNVIAQVNGKLIYKAFSNIIGNAITHSPNNSVVKVNLKKVDSTIIFEVKNSDVRIEEKEILKIFDAFYRVDKSRSRKTGGSGLGLYIVKMVFELHNIKYKIENTDDGVKFNAIFTTYNI
ncbi:ATP-binding protein [Clostridium carboxidivorans]|uniref:sensor histidine kinase n=1 Tax=Clostridium carboxidivorans TaxID=217159 RepID=UPI002FCDB864